MSRSRIPQRGAGTLVVSLLLLFAATIATLYLNRGIIFEQKTSANLVRSTMAKEVAEAGLEWALGMLNAPYDILDTCMPNTGGVSKSFRRLYVQTNIGASPSDSDFHPVTTVRPGCTMDPAAGGALTCSCPGVPSGNTIATAALSPSAPLPGFTVSFAPVAGDNESLRITAIGCSAYQGACTSDTAVNSDARATVTAIFKMRRVLLAGPQAALTCGLDCELSGSFQVANFDLSTNGITVNAGDDAVGMTGAIATIPGVPPSNSVVARDASLSVLATSESGGTCSLSRVFNAYFGSRIEDYRVSPTTKTISCSSANDCATQLQAAYADQWRAFYFPAATGLELNNSAPFSQLGTEADPVILVSEGDVKINAEMQIYGLIFSNDAVAGDVQTGSGGSRLNGALISCRDFESNGNGAILYNKKAIENVQSNTSKVVRLPGSWRDF